MELSRKESEAQQRLLENNLKISLLVEINEVLQQRQEVVQRHNVLLKNISDLQNQVQDTIKWIEALWDQKVADARGKGQKLQADLDQVRAELEAAHQASGTTMQPKVEPLAADGSKSAGKDMPSRRANYKITASRLQAEIKGFQQRVNATKLRLLNEIKARQQAEAEVRAMRQGLRAGSKTNSAAATPTPGPAAICYFGDPPRAPNAASKRTGMTVMTGRTRRPREPVPAPAIQHPISC